VTWRPPRLVKENEPKLADLNLVAISQYRRIHGLPVDIGAVETTEVDDVEFVVLPTEFRVFAADGDFVEKDVAAGVPTRRCSWLIQPELAAGAGAAFHHQ
jgi:hypothetical protein